MDLFNAVGWSDCQTAVTALGEDHMLVVAPYDENFYYVVTTDLGFNRVDEDYSFTLTQIEDKYVERWGQWWPMHQDGSWGEASESSKEAAAYARQMHEDLMCCPTCGITYCDGH